MCDRRMRYAMGECAGLWGVVRRVTDTGCVMGDDGVWPNTNMDELGPCMLRQIPRTWCVV